jgi:signal transduction histidine kinase
MMPRRSHQLETPIPDTEHDRRLVSAEERVAELESEVTRLRAAAQDARRVKDDFLATLSHELRTPLNAILGWLQLLRLHIDDPVQRDHALDVIERNARAQVQIVADLLDVSRVITGKMQLRFERVDLGTVVDDSTASLKVTAGAKNVSVAVASEPVPGTVYGDPARLRQVIWNLVGNAIKFTPPGGQVRVSVRPDASSAVVEVADTGIGIPKDLLPHVFERFKQGDSSLTRRFGGLGLGLAIVRHLVELHGGTVEAHSAGLDHGATFIVRIPRRDEPAL